MKVTTVFTTAAAVILPTAYAAKAYIPTVNSPGIASIHGQYVAANNGQFFIGKPTTATCPNYDLNCTYNNVTIITGPTYSGESGSGVPNQVKWWMGILEDGGQELYIPGGPIGGDMYYTAAASDNQLPYKSDPEDWLSLGNTTDGRTKFLGFGADLSACPTDEDGVYTIHANYNSPDGCILFEMIATETTTSAPQYYNCAGCQDRCYSTQAPCTGYFN